MSVCAQTGCSLFSLQTKDALFTILQDLRPEDHFNIIGFSSRIKVWQQDQLVPVTPNNIRDAKIYIHNMTPTGGNLGPQRAVWVLNSWAVGAVEDIGVVVAEFFSQDRAERRGVTEDFSHGSVGAV